MTRYALPILFLFIAFSPGPPAHSAERVKGSASRSTLTIYLENDVFAQTDENYTHGCGVAWISGDFSSWEKPFLLTRPFFGLLSLLGNTGSYRNVSVAFRQNIYTPADISAPHLLENDQPYAGVTFFPIGFHEKSSRSISSLELDVGIVGPHSYAKQVQRGVHGLIESRKPQGWDHQLKDEIILNLNYDRRWRFYESNMHRRFAFDVLPHYGASAGNMKTSLNSGVQLRMGWQLPNNFGSYIIQPSCECQVPADPDGPERDMRSPALSVYAFTELEGQGVLRDIFLDGNTFVASHSVDKKQLTGHVIVGAGVQVFGVKVNYSYVFQSRAFKTQKAEHFFGGLTVSVLF